MAVDAGLSVMAISDHDTVAAYDGSHRFAAGVRVIPAIEISSECDGEDVHILGYGIDTADAGLQAYCAQFKERRFNRALEIVDRCRSLGYDINRSGIEATLRQGGTVGRPHIARLLVAKGYFPDVKTVFDKLLYRGGPAYVPYHRRSIDDCVALIRQAGGTAILAHPGLLKRTLDQVLAHDFDGVEVYHPKNRGRYKEFLKLADRKKDINDDDILMLAGKDRTAMHRIKLEYLQVTSGVGLQSVASICLNIAGERFEAAASGNGPVDAAIKAVKSIIHRTMTIQEFLIQAINKGSDDMGKVHMQVEYEGNRYYGFAANTDIIAASVEAFIDAINKFVK